MQSSEGARQLNLELTPKMLKPLVKEWAPQAFIISFKVRRNIFAIFSEINEPLLSEDLLEANIKNSCISVLFILCVIFRPKNTSCRPGQ